MSHDPTGRRIEHEHGYLEYRFGPGETCEIVDVEVHPDHRLQGIGRKLLEKLFKEIRGRAKRVYAITRAENEMAQQWYEACQFRSCPLRRFYSGKTGVDAIMYVRGVEGPV